ncbi:hypothetical protein JCM12296A_50460 [Desulfosarcina cetonica]
MEDHRFFSMESQNGGSSADHVDKSCRDDNRQQIDLSGNVDVVALVRSLQRTAGLNDCFRKGDSNCTIRDCAWRAYCLETPDTRKK